MGGKFKQMWREFRRGRPGHRFQDRYQRNRRTRKDRPWYFRAVKITVAILLFLIGVVLVFIPGPAVLFFAAGAALLADQSRFVAHALDWTEVKLRLAVSKAKKLWRRASGPARIGTILAALISMAGAGYVCYRILAPA